MKHQTCAIWGDKTLKHVQTSLITAATFPDKNRIAFVRVATRGLDLAVLIANTGVACYHGNNIPSLLLSKTSPFASSATAVLRKCVARKPGNKSVHIRHQVCVILCCEQNVSQPVSQGNNHHLEFGSVDTEQQTFISANR